MTHPTSKSRPGCRTARCAALASLFLTACAGADAPGDSSKGLLTDLPEDIARQELVLRHVEELGEAGGNRVAAAPRLVKEMGALLGAVKQYEQRAEELKMVELMRCVRERRDASQELIEVAQGALDKLDTRARIGDDETVEYEYKRIAVSSQRLRGIVASIARCAEQHERAHTGPTEVEVEVDGAVE